MQVCTVCMDMDLTTLLNIRYCRVGGVSHCSEDKCSEYEEVTLRMDWKVLIRY